MEGDRNREGEDTERWKETKTDRAAHERKKEKGKDRQKEVTREM